MGITRVTDTDSVLSYRPISSIVTVLMATLEIDVKVRKLLSFQLFLAHFFFQMKLNRLYKVTQPPRTMRKRYCIVTLRAETMINCLTNIHIVINIRFIILNGQLIMITCLNRTATQKVDRPIINF